MKFEHHFEPTCGWINDPNGLCFYGGRYHAFFQYYPHAPEWVDCMSWGHAVSQDLVHWTQTDTALFPDEPYENNGGCYSGSAIVKDGELHLFYTSVSEQYGQAQSHAVSTDGMHFIKDAQNPIIPAAPWGKTKSFRDPYVFEAFGTYYMVVGGRENAACRVLLYSSFDLSSWKYLGVLYENEAFGGTPECPNFFALGDKWVLLLTVARYTSPTVFIVGDFDGKCFTPECMFCHEFGEDWNAPQTFLAPDGRRLAIGWLYHWKKALPHGATTAGALSLARELTWENGRLFCRPVREARHLLRSECEYVRVQGSVLTVHGLDGRIVLQRDFDGVNGIRKIEQTDILFDRKAVEIFINGGAATVSQWLI